MAPCYSKNGILKGTVDFYCLVCETYLRSEADNICHIAKPIHKKNLDSTHYVKDFGEDFIRKIKKGYFCELCNKLLPMLARVKIHVKEPAHIDSKNVMYFKRNGVCVIAFGKVVLNDKAWNGLHEESCAFCNTEYEDEEIHKNQLSHILNIIQIKVEVDENKNIYRKIDDVSFHCLTCNMVLALNNITHHFEEDQHKQLYQECCAISLNSINNNELKEEEASTVIVDQSDKTNEHLNMPLNNTGENTDQEHSASNSDVNIKCDVLEETTAIDPRTLNEICEKEKESKNATNSVVKKEFKDLKEHCKDCFPNTSHKTEEIKKESMAVQDNVVDKKNKKLADKKVKKNKTKINPSELNNNKRSEISNEINKTTKSKSSFNIEEYEKQICKMLKTENYITIDENGKTLCILCDWIMDPKNKKVHCSGLHHQTMEKMHKRRLAEIRDRNKKNVIGGETRDKNNIENTVQNKSILDLVSKFQADNVNINLLFNTAVCKKCTINLPYDVDAIEEHILKHNKNTCKENDNVTLQSREIKETCENSTKVTIEEKRNENEEKVVTIENIKEEPTIKQAPVNTEEKLISNETVSGINEPSVSIYLQKQSLANYIKILSAVKHMIFQDVIINEVVCISFLSFNYFLSTKGEVKCLICEKEVRDVEAHINTLKHLKLINNLPVILNEKTEFVREIHPNLLHCGFCNTTVLSWSEMQEHFTSSLHKESKDAAGWRLMMYSTKYSSENHYKKVSVTSESAMRNMLCGLF